MTWSSRIHAAGIFAVGFLLILIVISFVVPNDPRENSQVAYWITLLSIVSLLAFIFWMIYLLRFNVFKRYGTWKQSDSLKTYLYYFIIILLIVSWPFVPPIVESVRADSAYSTNEMARDIDDMNIRLCQLERDSIDKRFPSDTFEVSKIDRGITVVDREAPPPPSPVEAAPTAVGTSYREKYYFIDKNELQLKLANADSVKQLSDSVYVIYDCPTYKFIYQYRLDEHGGHLMSSMDLYRKVLQYNEPFDMNKVRSELGALFVKYSRLHNPVTLTHPYYDFGHNETFNYEARIRDQYDLRFINNSIDNITEKKYRWDKGMIDVCLRSAYYVTLILTMLVFIYRHTTRRTFFLSLLSAVVLTILTSLFIAIGNSENSFFVWVIVYFILFGSISAFIANSRSRNLFSGIGLNLFVFMTPFMPLVVTAYYYQILRERYFYSNYYKPDEYGKLFENEEYHLFLSEIGGTLLLILLLATLYHKAYKKWYSLPEL